MHVEGLPLPVVSFTTHDQAGIAAVKDKVSQAYGYNDGETWTGVDGDGQYMRWIQPMESDLSKQVEYDMDEQDQAWLDLVNLDRKRLGLDPVSYEIFEILIDKLEKEWFDLVKRIPKKEGVMPVEDSKCAICDDGECENSNAIVFCDGCNLAVHQDCYGVPYIPEGQWLCRKCTVSPDRPVSCVLCPNSYGAFKQTTNAQWAHLLCAIWIPDTGVSNTIYMEPIDGVENISRNRWKLVCYLCRKRMGACIQCANRNCFTAFHVTCARERGLELKMKAGGDRGELSAYCDKHSLNMLPFPEEPHKRSHRRMPEQSSSDRGYRDQPPITLRPPVQKSSKSARAYKKSYSSGPPVIPAFIFNRLLEYVIKIKISKKSLFVGMLCRYWSLKREARRGAPLLKRLHLEPWTASASSRHQTDHQKAQKLEHMQLLKQDLERVREVVELAKQREQKKLARVHLLKKVIDDFVFSKDKIMRTVLDRIILLDEKGTFSSLASRVQAPDHDVKAPLDWSTLRDNLDRHEYLTAAEFKNDVESVFSNARMDVDAESAVYKYAVEVGKLAEPILAELESIDQMDSLPTQHALELSAMLTDEYLETLFDYQFETPENLTPPPPTPIELPKVSVPITNSMLSSAIERLDSIEPEEEEEIKVVEKEVEKVVEKPVEKRIVKEVEKVVMVEAKVEAKGNGGIISEVALPALERSIAAKIPEARAVVKEESINPVRFNDISVEVTEIKQTPKSRKRKIDTVATETPEFAPPRARRSATVIPKVTEPPKVTPKPRPRRPVEENRKGRANQAYIPPSATSSRRPGSSMIGASRTRQEYIILEDDRNSFAHFDSSNVLPEGSSRRRSGGLVPPPPVVKRVRAPSIKDTPPSASRSRANKDQPARPRGRRPRPKPPAENVIDPAAQDSTDSTEQLRGNPLESGVDRIIESSESLTPVSTTPAFELQELPRGRLNGLIENDGQSEMSDLTDLEDEEEKVRIPQHDENHLPSQDYESTPILEDMDERFEPMEEEMEVEEKVILPLEPIFDVARLESVGNAPAEAAAPAEPLVEPQLDVIMDIEEELLPITEERAEMVVQELLIEPAVDSRIELKDEMVIKEVEDLENLENPSARNAVEAEAEPAEMAIGVDVEEEVEENVEVDEVEVEIENKAGGVKPKGKNGRKKGRARLNEDGLTFNEARTKWESRLKELTELVTISKTDTLLDGHLVWAKLSGFPTFPAEVADPAENDTPGKLAKLAPKDSSKVLVMFFDDRRSAAWVTKSELRHLGENLEIDEMLQSAMACAKSKTFKGGASQAISIQKAYKWAVSLTTATPPPEGLDPSVSAEPVVEAALVSESSSNVNSIEESVAGPSDSI